MTKCSKCGRTQVGGGASDGTTRAQHHQAIVDAAEKRFQAAADAEHKARTIKQGAAKRLEASRRAYTLRVESPWLDKETRDQLIQVDQQRMKNKNPLKLPYPTELKPRLQKYVEEDAAALERADAAFEAARLQRDAAKAALDFERSAPADTGCPALSTKCPPNSQHRDKCAKVDLALSAQERQAKIDAACAKKLPMFAGIRGITADAGLVMPIA